MSSNEAASKSPMGMAVRSDSLAGMARYLAGNGVIRSICSCCGACRLFVVTVEDSARLDGFDDWKPLERYEQLVELGVACAVSCR